MSYYTLGAGLYSCRFLSLFCFLLLMFLTDCIARAINITVLPLVFRRVLQNCENIILAALCLSVFPLSVRLSAWKTRLPLEGFSRNLLFEYSPKIRKEDSS